MNTTTHQSIAVAIHKSLQAIPAAKEDSSIDSPDFCMEDLRFTHQLGPLQMLGTMLAKLKGKRIETVDWVQTFRGADGGHVGFFRIKVS